MKRLVLDSGRVGTRVTRSPISASPLSSWHVWRTVRLTRFEYLEVGDEAWRNVSRNGREGEVADGLRVTKQP